MPDAVLDTLRGHADPLLDRAYVPYTKRPVAAALLLSDGAWVPGVRVENASYPLLVPAPLAAYYASRCAGRADVVAVVQTRPLPDDAAWFFSSALGRPFRRAAPDALVADGVALPDPTGPLSPFLDADAPAGDASGVALARSAATRAFVPESGFPVGCVVEDAAGRLVPGCNVEHADWTRGLCAERVALVTARSHGVTSIRRLTLSCPQAADATPCGACRQVLAEMAPGVPVVMDRGEAPPEATTPERLLPGAFSGDVLRA